MNALTYRGFKNECDRQGAKLHSGLANLETPVSDDEFRIDAPSPMLKAVATAGGMLREDPTATLAEQPIKPEAKFERSSIARALIGIINASIKPEVGPVDLPYTWEGVDVCRQADFKFLDLINQLSEGAGAGQIIGSGQPALLRKTQNGEKSALSVRDLVVNGIPYPAGSIFKVKMSDEDELSTHMPDVLQSVDLSRVGGLGFMRLSVFAVDENERASNFRSLDLSSPDADSDTRTLGTMTIGDVAAIVNEAERSAVATEEFVSRA